jgi:hypothetical protein
MAQKLSPLLRSGKKTIKIIPLDRQRVKDDGEFFGRTFLQKKPIEKNGHIVYQVKVGDVTLDYRFDKKKVNELKKILFHGVELEENLFSLGRRAALMWYSLVYLVAVQGGVTKGIFRIADIVEIWKSKPSGKLYNDIKQTFLSLAAFNPYYNNGQSGKDRIEWGHSFFDAWVIKGEGDSAIFEYELNRIALGITTDWLENGLSLSTLKGGYFPFHIQELEKLRADDKYENLVERIRLLPPGVMTVKCSTLLRDWMKLREDMLRRHKKCHDLIYKYLQKACDNKEIASFRYHVHGGKNWLEKETILIEKIKRDALKKKLQSKRVCA